MQNIMGKSNDITSFLATYRMWKPNRPKFYPFKTPCILTLLVFLNDFQLITS